MAAEKNKTFKKATKKQQEQFLEKIDKGKTKTAISYMLHPRNLIVARYIEPFAYSKMSKEDFVGEDFEVLFVGSETEDKYIIHLDLDADPSLIDTYGWNLPEGTQDQNYHMPVIEVQTEDYKNFSFKFENHHIYLNRFYKDVFDGKEVETSPRVTEIKEGEEGYVAE